MTATASSYPLRYDVEYPERLSRWLILVKWLLAIPHFLILYALGAVAYVIIIVAWFAILFTGRYPEGLFKFAVGVYRWNANVSAYLALMRDEYPPFSMEAGRYPVTLEMDYPERLSRWLIFVKWLLVIPNVLVMIVLALAYYVTLIIAWFTILFTGRYPEGLFRFGVGVNRWGLRVSAYAFYLFTDKYPPFSLS
jgi:hypothetical protein